MTYTQDNLHAPVWMHVMREFQTDKMQNPTRLSKVVGVTYSHVTAVLKALENLGFLTSEKSGRVKWYVLSESGIALAKSVGFTMKVVNIKPNRKEDFT